MIAAAAGGASRAHGPGTARLLVPRPAPATSRSGHPPYEDAAPLKSQAARGRAEGELAAPTTRCGQERAAIALEPTSAAAYNNLGNLYRSEDGRSEEATAMYRGALLADPRHAFAYNNLANMLKADGRV